LGKTAKIFFVCVGKYNFAEKMLNGFAEVFTKIG